MKLNYKRTVFVGFAFFLICSFWQAYDNTIPLILTNKFGMSQAWSGVIMALDNVLALFMLPLFGAISDKHRGKRGRRTPFIVVGTLVAAVMLIALSFVDNAQLKHLSDVSAIDDPAALEQIYDRQADETLLTPGGDKFVLSQKFTQEEFCQIRSQVEQNGSTVTNPDYTNYVVPARQACAWDATAKSPVTLVFFIVLLLIVLVSMAVFRSPAVALMPDVTLKPLRSKANAVINLMGSAGGILVLALGMVFATSAVRNSLMSYTGYFAVIAAIMLVALVIFMLTVREKEWAYEMQQQAVALGIEEETQEQEETEGGRKLSVDEVRSLILLLLSIVLWFFGYNAVTSKYSVYASNILHKDYNLTLIIAQAAAIVSYLPVGFIAGKIGRKKTILAGVVMLTVAFVPGFLAALIAYSISLKAGVAPTRFVMEAPPLDARTVVRTAVLAMCCAVVAVIFCQMLHFFEHEIPKLLPNPWVRAAAGGAAVVALSYLMGVGRYNGAGMDVIMDAVELEQALPWDFVCKMVLTVLTLSVGFKGGEVVPSFYIGATFGCVVGPLLGLPAGFSAAVGLVCVFCGATNTLVASIVLAAELFSGAGFELMALACGLSYMFSGYHSLYSSQGFRTSKLFSEFLQPKEEK